MSKNCIYKVLPPLTVNYLRCLSKQSGKPEKDFYSLAYLVMLKCRDNFKGDEKYFPKYLNKSIRYYIINQSKRKQITFTSLDEDIENYGYNQPFNDEVNDFRIFVKKKCSTRANLLLKMFLDQPAKMRLYCQKHRKESKSNLLLMFQFLKHEYPQKLGSTIVCRKLVQELKNAKRQYDSL